MHCGYIPQEIKYCLMEALNQIKVWLAYSDQDYYLQKIIFTEVLACHRFPQ